MKKILMLVISLLFAPLIALAVGGSDTNSVNSPNSVNSANSVNQVNPTNTIEDPSLVAASYQQGEDADPAPPIVTKPPVVKVPDQAAETAKTDSNFSKEITGLSQLVDDLQNNQSELQQRLGNLQQQINKQQYLLAGLASFMVILFVLTLIAYRKKSLKTVRAATLNPPEAIKPKEEENDTQCEYDFMGSSEAIPAKLDLARAYIAMEDYVAARETLAEIIGDGNSEEHRQEAKVLLAKIN